MPQFSKELNSLCNQGSSPCTQNRIPFEEGVSLNRERVQGNYSGGGAYSVGWPGTGRMLFGSRNSGSNSGGLRAELWVRAGPGGGVWIIGKSIRKWEHGGRG